MKTEIITCYPVKQVDEDGNFVDLNEEVDLGDGRKGIRQGRDVIQIIADEDGSGHWFDPLTGEGLKKTKRGDGLWSKKEKIWRNVTSKGKHKTQKREWLK